MTWSTVPKPKHHREHNDMQLRVVNKNTGYLDVGARRYLFGAKFGYIRFEEEGSQVSIVPVQNKIETDDVRVTTAGRFSALQITTRTSVAPPFSILLKPSDAEPRLMFAGLK